VDAMDRDHYKIHPSHYCGGLAEVLAKAQNLIFYIQCNLWLCIYIVLEKEFARNAECLRL
jgi:hypothetical protein